VLDLNRPNWISRTWRTRLQARSSPPPFDGQVLSLNIKAGDTVAPTMRWGGGRPRKLEITAELSSDELSQMALEQQARITLRNRPGETFTCRAPVALS